METATAKEVRAWEEGRRQPAKPEAAELATKVFEMEARRGQAVVRVQADPEEAHTAAQSAPHDRGGPMPGCSS